MFIKIPAIAAVAVLSTAALPAVAATTAYNFTPLNGSSFGGTTGTTSETLQGATFKQNGSAPYSFVFGNNGGLFSNIDGGAGTILTTAGYAGATPGGVPASLTISFASTVYSLAFDFANSDFLGSNGGDLLTATINGATVATVSPTYSSTSPDLYAEGSFFYATQKGFKSITLTSTDAAGAEDLALGDMKTSSTPVPLPAAAWLLISGLGGVAGFARRRAARSA